MGVSVPRQWVREGGTGGRASGAPSEATQRMGGDAQSFLNLGIGSAGSRPRHHVVQKYPLSRSRMSDVARSQSRSMASLRRATAMETTRRAGEEPRTLPWSRRHRTLQMHPMKVTRRRVQSARSRGSLEGLSVCQPRRSSASMIAVVRGGGAIPVRMAHAEHNQGRTGEKSGHSKKTWVRVSGVWDAQQVGEEQ